MNTSYSLLNNDTWNTSSHVFVPPNERSSIVNYHYCLTLWRSRAQTQWHFRSYPLVFLQKFKKSYIRSAQIAGARSPGRQNFIRNGIFVDLQYGSCFMSPIWRLELWVVSYIFGKSVDPCPKLVVHEGFPPARNVIKPTHKILNSNCWPNSNFCLIYHSSHLQKRKDFYPGGSNHHTTKTWPTAGTFNSCSQSSSGHHVRHLHKSFQH